MTTTTKASRTEPSSDTFVQRATRYEPTLSDACLTWESSGPDHDPGMNPAETTAHVEAGRQFALLLDISQTGASIALDQAPRPGDGVWLRMGGDCVDRWNQAKVVGVSTTTQGPHLVRLAFRSPCPFETLVSVICG